MAPVVLITGCSGNGIGFHLAQAFHTAGCRVFASARSMKKLQATPFPPGVEQVELDVCQPALIQAAVDDVVRRAGQIDILVNNAGQGCVGALAEVDMEKVRGTFETNVFGLLSTSQAVSKSMIARRKGLIVNISSIVSFVPTPWAGSECGTHNEASYGADEGRPVYCATKASVTSLSDVLRMELGGFGVQVMCVFPGAIKSDIGAANAASASHTQGGPYANVRHHIEARGSWSQGPHSTPAADLAAQIVKCALLPSPPHYLTAGHRSTRAWLSYYLPARWKDYFWGTRYFGLAEVGQERPSL